MLWFLAQGTITVPAFQIDLSSVLYWLVIGLVAGLIAGLFVRRRRFGLIGAVVLGLIGAVIGGILFNLLQINIAVGNAFLTGPVRDIIAAFFGAILLILLMSATFGRRYID
jgi:uncharacterized membrane protein YeaQ/YmgE (transglycosylase-associated protein family)